MSIARKKFEGSKAETTDLHLDPDIVPIEAPLNANVWKVEAQEGQVVDKEDVIVAILEAMKLEIPVKTGKDVLGTKIEKLLVKPGDVVEAGKPLVLLRKGAS